MVVWRYGISAPIDESNYLYNELKVPIVNILPLSEFWSMAERGFIDLLTVGQFVEIYNFDGTTTKAFEDDIIEKGGDNHNAVIIFCNSCFQCTEPKIDNFQRIHSLPHLTTRTNIIGNVIDNKKLLYRWGRS